MSSFFRKSVFPRQALISAPVYRPTVKPKGIAGELAAAAEQSSDPHTRATLNAIVPRVARMERTIDEIAADAREDDLLRADAGSRQ